MNISSKCILFYNVCHWFSFYIKHLLPSIPASGQRIFIISHAAGIILCMCPADERWRYIITSPFIGWVHTRIDPWSWCHFYITFWLSAGQQSPHPPNVIFIRCVQFHSSWWLIKVLAAEQCITVTKHSSTCITVTCEGNMYFWTLDSLSTYV